MAIITGTTGNDILTGTNLNDSIKGDNGNDILNGLDGDDILDGGAGNDVINSGNGNDILQGGLGNDVLLGGTGNNTLDGGSGADAMTGGDGNDTYVVDNIGDTVTESALGGTDTVQSSVTYTLSPEVENLTLTGVAAINGTGNASNNIIIGNDGVNTLTGGDGNDSLDGGTGGDLLIGGLGDDIYTVDNAHDRVVENPGEGHDTVFSVVSYTLTADVEDLVLTSGSAINGTGNDLNNQITGNFQDNTLDGGLGADFLSGVEGNDTYIVDNVGDTVLEFFKQGTDTIRSSVTYTLPANVENIVLTGTAAIDATGNTDDNVLTGNSATNVLTALDGNDTLDGGGGADTMVGGLGNDTYIVDNALDVVTEAAGEGTADTVKASVSYTISDPDVEILTLTGTSAINGTGNGSDNIITGNSGNNTLDGGGGNDTLSGGGGTDVLRGGAGNDIYLITATTGQTVVENAGEGTADLVKSSATYTLTAEVENLILTGASAINGTGNALVNIITGNGAVNTLDGGGGLDTLAGGGGNDTYIVNNAGVTITENPGEGTDLVLAGVSFTLATDVENITLTGTSAINATGNAQDNVLTGNSAANILTGGLGNDTYVIGVSDTIGADTGGNDTVSAGFTYSIAARADLENITLTGTGNFNATGNAGNNILVGNSGNNILSGGLGNDTYFITAHDTIVDTGGVDTVVAGFTYTLGAGLDNLTLTGTGNFNLTGNALDNVLTGNSGNNTLDGVSGTDTLAGGSGDDTYIVHSALDIVIENPGEGHDTIKAGFSYSLAGAPDVDNLVLTGTGNFNGTGNALENTITGNNGNNTLDGGAGADHMIGGAGNDTYIVDSAGDVIQDTTGTDSVYASVDYTLAVGVEKLFLVGTGNISGTGNALVNTIMGTIGNNTLDGGTGNDTLIGGQGDDTYVVNSAKDVVLENIGEGYDTVLSSTTYTLPHDVENLTLTGSTNIAGTGNALDNIITGNAGANPLHGGDGQDVIFGGSGNDTLYGDIGNDTLSGDDGLDHLYGGTGADVFVFKASSAFGAVDAIMDYSLADGDVIDVSDVLAGHFNPATDDPNNFVRFAGAGYIQIDITGTGTHWQNVAFLTGVHPVLGQTVVDLLI